MTFERRSANLFLAVIAFATTACTNVPQGYGSGEYTVSRDVPAPTSAVWEAAREFLLERGDSPEIVPADGGGLLRTGDLRIQVLPGDEGGTRLLVHQAKYVGTDYQERARRVADGIVARVR